MKQNDATWEKITINGETYQWQVRHGWFLEDGLNGTSISVAIDPGRSRELILDFPFSVFGRERRPKQTHLEAALLPAIQEAIAAGWKPDSRGRAFRFNPSAP